jgi:CRP/FNR family transcriptional regulator
MSREDIGSYLGMQIETVSRLLSRFSEAGLLQVKQRHVKFIDLPGLRLLGGQTALDSPDTNSDLNSCPVRGGI